MSFSFDTKNELCKLPIQRRCCALAEAYGILLYCHTFSSSEVRIITGNPNFVARLPRLFQRAFDLRFDRQPDPEREEGGKMVFQITEREKLDCIIDRLGYDPRQSLALHVNFAMVEEECCRASFFRGCFFCWGKHHGPLQALPFRADQLPSSSQPRAGGAAPGEWVSAQKPDPKWKRRDLF